MEAGSTPVLVHNAPACDPIFEGAGFQHVLAEHVEGSPDVDYNATLFADGLDPDKIGDLIIDTVNNPDKVVGNTLSRNGVVYTKTYSTAIGDSQGADSQPLYTLQVVLNPDGSLRTSFPIR